jgi:proliferating cell nuclear antigen
MNIQLSDKKKKDCFISLFQVLKSCSSTISITLNSDMLYIQGIDKSHICLFEVKIDKKWFSKYELLEKSTSGKKLAFDSNNFYSIISIKSDNNDLVIQMNKNETDTIHILFQPTGSIKGEFKKSFKMPLIDYDYEELNIPSVEYDAEFTLSSKQITDVFNQFSNFGNDIIIECSEEQIVLMTTGVTGEMRVDIPIDDISNYSIVEGEVFTLTYSLAYLNKMCVTNKLSNEIEFFISSDYPMKIHYNLEDDSSLVFYMAPKINDN